MSTPKEIKINTPEQNIAKTLKGKKMLFLENDNGLHHGLDELENILKRNNIEYAVLFEIDKKPIEDIIKAINEHDGIIFMTQWVYEVSRKLKEYMFSLKEKKIVIETYISEPSFYYKPKSAHDVYIYKCPMIFSKPDKKHESFYKLSQKPYWDYKNKFNR